MKNKLHIYKMHDKIANAEMENKEVVNNYIPWDLIPGISLLCQTEFDYTSHSYIFESFDVFVSKRDDCPDFLFNKYGNIVCGGELPDFLLKAINDKLGRWYCIREVKYY